MVVNCEDCIHNTTDLDLLPLEPTFQVLQPRPQQLGEFHHTLSYPSSWRFSRLPLWPLVVCHRRMLRCRGTCSCHRDKTTMADKETSTLSGESTPAYRWACPREASAEAIPENRV